MHFKRVDFPAPLGPSTATSSWSPTSKVMPLNALIPPYEACRFSTLSTSILPIRRFSEVGIYDGPVGLHFLRYSIADGPAKIEYSYPITDLHDHTHMMLDQEHRQVKAFPNVPYEPDQLH